MLTISKITSAKDSVINLIHNGRDNSAESRIMGLLLEEYPCAWKFAENFVTDNFLDELEGYIRTNKKYRKALDIVYDKSLAEDCPTFIFQKNMVQDHVMFGNNTAQIIDMPPNEISAAENSLDIAVWNTERGTYDLVLDYDASRYSENSMKDFAILMDKAIYEMKQKGC